jgi:hypothetical protein
MEPLPPHYNNFDSSYYRRCSLKNSSSGVFRSVGAQSNQLCRALRCWLRHVRDDRQGGGTLFHKPPRLCSVARPAAQKCMICPTTCEPRSAPHLIIQALYHTSISISPFWLCTTPHEPCSVPPSSSRLYTTS